MVESALKLSTKITMRPFTRSRKNVKADVENLRTLRTKLKLDGIQRNPRLLFKIFYITIRFNYFENYIIAVERCLILKIKMDWRRMSIDERDQKTK